MNPARSLAGNPDRSQKRDFSKYLPFLVGFMNAIFGQVSEFVNRKLDDRAGLENTGLHKFPAQLAGDAKLLAQIGDAYLQIR